MRTFIMLGALIGACVAGTAHGDKAITLEDLKKHNMETDCWMAIEGTVYDMSAYIKLHSKKCKEMKFSDHCGTDASTVWKQKESGPEPHKKKSLRSFQQAKVGIFTPN